MESVDANSPRPPLSGATLYLVATPIGNIEDITARALRTLRDCDVVAAEDTRRAGSLLQRFGIRRPLLSYHRFNEARRSHEIMARLGNGEKVALISDAGMPGISDPGQRVVAAALKAGFRVEAVPGPCAFVAALTASGLPTDEVHFLGFLPHKSGKRRSELKRLSAIPGTVALYESPYRVDRLLSELAEVMPDRVVVLARELTKKFEEYLRGTPGELIEATRGRHWKGEFTVLIGPAPEPQNRDGPGPTLPGCDHLCVMPNESGPSPLFRLALAQMLVIPGDPEANRAKAEHWIRKAKDTGAEVVLLPEVLDFGWTHSSARDGAGPIPGGESVERLREAAVASKLYVCAGLAERDGERIYNAAVLIDPEGEIILHHRKIHEIPFARALYATGDRLGVVDTSLGRLGLMICADALNPGNVVARSLASMGAHGILSPCAWAVPPAHDPSKTPYGQLWVDHYGAVAGESGLWIAGKRIARKRIAFPRVEEREGSEHERRRRAREKDCRRKSRRRRRESRRDGKLH